MSLLQMSFSGAVLIIVIAAIRAVTINRLPKKTFIILWGIVLFRLIIPYTVPSVFSVYTLINSKTSVIENRNNSENTYTETLANRMLSAIKITPYEQNDESSQVSADEITHVSIKSVIRIVGMILCTAFFIISYFHWYFEFQTSLPIQNDFVNQWRKKHPLKRPVSVRQSAKISAPLTYGIIKPVILMPEKTDWENAEQLEYVLLHEYVHIRRYDSVAKLLSTFAFCLHWFNPFVWVMYILLQRDLELACDESVVRRFGEPSKSTYAHILIDMEARKSGFMPICNSFSKNAIEERIIAIMKIKKTSVITMLTAVILVISVTIAFATTAANRKAENNNTNFTNEEAAQLLESEESNTGVIDIDALNIRDESFEDAKMLKIGVINTDALKIRDEAFEDAEVLSLLQETQAVVIASEKNGFYHVFIPSDEGNLEGWVRKEYVDMN